MMKQVKQRFVSIITKFLMQFRSFRFSFKQAVQEAQGFIHGSYDLTDEAAIAVSMLPPSGGIIIDGGANAGRWSRAVLEQAAAKKIQTLLMIEPNDYHVHAHQLLHKEFNDIISTEWVALGSRSSTMILHSNQEGGGLASLYNREISHHGIKLEQSQVVKVEKLVDIAQQYQLDRIDFLKLDLEGHELEALKGAEPLLEKQTIRAIQFEFGGCNIDSRTYLRDFWQLLHDKHQYSFYRLIPNRKLMKLENYSENLEWFTWQNLLACAPEVSPKQSLISSF